jgi:hypothetical protein
MEAEDDDFLDVVARHDLPVAVHASRVRQDGKIVRLQGRPRQEGSGWRRGDDRQVFSEIGGDMLWTFIAVGTGCLAGGLAYALLKNIWVRVTWFVFGWKPRILLPSQVKATVRDCSKEYIEHCKAGVTEEEIADYTRWVIETYVLNFYLPTL